MNRIKDIDHLDQKKRAFAVQTKTYFQSPQRIMDTPVVKVGYQLTLNDQLFCVRQDGSVEVLSESQSTHIFGIDAQLLDQTTSHKPSTKTEANGVVFLEQLSERQRQVVKKFRLEPTVGAIYLYQSNGIDKFVIVTKEDAYETTRILTALFWEIYDLHPDYKFDFEPIFMEFFSKKSLPENAIECYSEVHL